MNDVDPQAWLADVLARIATHPAHRLDELVAAMELAPDDHCPAGCRLMPNGRSAGPSVPEKALITASCQNFIDQRLKPRFLPVIRPTEFNYPVDIRGKWQGPRYRFVQRYRSGFPENLGEEFDAPFARLDWVSRDRFDIQWHRHTGAWFCLYRDRSLAEAINILETDGILHPL